MTKAKRQPRAAPSQRSAWCWHTQEAAGLLPACHEQIGERQLPFSLPSLPIPQESRREKNPEKGLSGAHNPKTSAVVVCNQGTPVSTLRVGITECPHW